MCFTYVVRMCVTDIYGCDALKVEMKILNAHSFSEALVLAERNLCHMQRIISVDGIWKE